MPKVSKVGRFRASASSRNVKASPLNDDYLKNGSGLFDKQPDSVKASDAKEVSVSMSRGQRKRQAKKDRQREAAEASDEDEDEDDEGDY